ncbi:unnamed protein product [Lathyrus sativus]|nr:unnamed protein product [Lathyrus sativus]
MEGLDGVVAIFPDKKRPLLTTKSWDFIGFPMNVKRNSYESDVIIGVIDSGVCPQSESFNDKGFGPPPKKWKGVCESYNFTCNNKLVGAIGVLTQGQGFRDVADYFPLAGSYLQPKDASSIHKYIHSVRTPMATTFKSHELENALAPVVATFSSRGPNLVTPDILKLDLIAPGVDIIASWSPIIVIFLFLV